ncbi:RidA family protein [Herbaspirillum rubrisubalbicans]|uniref:RidA family protein n=1 Tax=Herbaspirillum rubrisubalbicans TaxID=80842 RepID=A0AAD0U6A8_9BURK|nr:RidA family protein [Herbaspirillum rubrisubalbicans]ALU88160.1 translation initiation inhibitor protein [Herbaspirillum rubrisubalbicans M1]AYR23231.1 RidA family protein [Herbaspirillum rubrisubalbicans]
MNHDAHPSHYPVTINPLGLATPGGHYSHVTTGNGMVFISGQLPIDASGRKLTEASFEAQALQVLANVEAALVGAGSEIGKLLQVRIYVTDVAHWPLFNELYARWAGAAKPARAVVPVPALHFGLQIEVEATALL